MNIQAVCLRTLCGIVLSFQVANAANSNCHGLSGAVLAHNSSRLRTVLSTGCNPNRVGSGLNPLKLAISIGDVEATRILLDAGADPNAIDDRGISIVHWLGSGRQPQDDHLLEVAKLLTRYHCNFKEGKITSSVDLIGNLAPRRVPKTLAYLASQKVDGDYNRALKSISRGDDAESVRALLGAGADPLSGVALTSPLFDAGAAGRTSLVRLMLEHIGDKSAPKVLAAYQSTIQQGHLETAKVFADAGVRNPEPVAKVQENCPTRALNAEEISLLKKLGLPNTNGLLGLAGGMNCKFVQQCGDILLIDCNSAADGPAYYIDQKASQILATCGGACMRGCQNCPPKQWNCSCSR